MHRRMSLGIGLFLLLFLVVGVMSASAEPLAGAQAGDFGILEDLLDQVWEWVESLMSGGPRGGSNPGQGAQDGFNGEGGGFIDPLGGNG